MLDPIVPTEMSEAALWALIVGFFVPIVAGRVLSASWKPEAKALVGFAVSAVVGVGVALFSGAYEGLGVPSVILLTVVVSIAAYEGFWKKVAPAASQRGAAEVRREKAAEEEKIQYLTRRALRKAETGEDLP